MRPLTETETQTLFQKLAHYTGSSLKNLIAPLDDSPNADRYVFRIHKDRVYYVRLSIANLAVSIGEQHICAPSLTPQSTSRIPPPSPGARATERKERRKRPHRLTTRPSPLPERDKLVSLGICLGKFTKTGKFRLHITSLPILAEHARYKIWVKPNGEMPFLYGGNIVKAHVGRWSEDCPEHQGVIVYSMADTPLGFGVTARSTAEARRLDPTGITCFRQADCGEYLRDEDNLFATG